jgi:hypothetical protein
MVLMYDGRYVLLLTAADARPTRSTLPSVWTTSVAWLRTFKADLTVHVVTQVHLGISSIVSYCQVVVEQLDALAGRLAAAAQRGNPVATQCTASITPMHLTDLESGRVTAAWHAVVRGALRDSPCLLHVVHLKVTERDVPCVAIASTYSELDVLRSKSLARDTMTYLHRLADSQC